MVQMTKMGRIRAMGYLAAGSAMAKLSRHLGVAKSTITHLRKTIVILGDMVRIIRMIKRQPFFSTVRVKQCLGERAAHLSVRMIQKVCVKAGYSIGPYCFFGSGDKSLEL